MNAALNKSGPVLLVAGWLALLVWLVPGRVVLRGDDFGYVESVVDTVRAQSWRPSDWVEPLNLPLTAISVLCYEATGNFYVSTLGVSLLLAAVNFLLLERYLRIAVPGARGRWLIVLGLALSPVWLNKALEFTGMSLGLTCTLAAWLCWRRGWWSAFFACVLVGFLNRQSALCLLAWPLVALVRQWHAGSRLNGSLLAGMACVLAAALTVLQVAPSTWARELAGRQMQSGISWIGLIANVGLALVVLAGWQAVWGALGGDDLCSLWRANLARPAIPLLWMSLGTGLVLGLGGNLLWETPGLEGVSLLLLTGATVMGAWCRRWDAGPGWEVGTFLAGYVLLVALRGRWWDYYFIEPMLALMWVAAPAPEPAAGARRIAWVGGLLGLGLVSAVLFKSYLRETEEKTLAYEGALRRGEVAIGELSDAPFGFMGWKLFGTARARADATGLVDFLKFVEGSRARFRDGTFTVNREGGRKSTHPTRERWTLPPDHEVRPLPLDNAEWRNYIARPPAK